MLFICGMTRLCGNSFNDLILGITVAAGNATSYLDVGLTYRFGWQLPDDFEVPRPLLSENMIGTTSIHVPMTMNFRVTSFCMAAMRCWLMLSCLMATALKKVLRYHIIIISPMP